MPAWGPSRSDVWQARGNSATQASKAGSRRALRVMDGPWGASRLAPGTDRPVAEGPDGWAARPLPKEATVRPREAD